MYVPAHFSAGDDQVQALLERSHDCRGAADSWSVDDAPADFIAAQLKAIVGVRLRITRIEGKVKMSQNRPAQDVAGVVQGLRERDPAASQAVAEANGIE